jgi:hypothetical protein
MGNIGLSKYQRSKTVEGRNTLKNNRITFDFTLLLVIHTVLGKHKQMFLNIINI